MHFLLYIVVIKYKCANKQYLKGGILDIVVHSTLSERPKHISEKELEPELDIRGASSHQGEMNYERFINCISAKRKPSLIREMSALLAKCGPNMIPLYGGMPNPEMFPFKSATVEISDGSKIEVAGAEMASALQYLPTYGHGELVTWLKNWQIDVHNPPEAMWGNSELLITSGSQDGLCRAFEMLLNEGDSVIVEDYIYSGTLAIMNPYKPKYLVVHSDQDGMRPDKLREVLAYKRQSCGGAPKIMYINPTGANPTGTVLKLERRKEIYQIACEYDILILEDDPYFFMQFSKCKVPSLFSMDTEGRVLRFDSFSKILSSGIRLGFVTGPKPLVKQIMLHMQVSVINAASLSQVVTNKLLQLWGNDGLKEHISQVAKFYEERRDAMLAAADKHLTGLCEWRIPQGGMYLWIKVHGVDDTYDMIMERAIQKNVMLLPGKTFSTEGGNGCKFLRAAYSIASVDKMDVAFQRLATLIEEELKLRYK